jgi:hypothetical protein
MKHIQFSFVFLFFSFSLLAQEQIEQFDLNSVDSLYREDQFYFGFHINLMDQLPDGVSQSGLSGGIMAGFIRDMPINKRRNWAIGLGLGLSANTYGHNLFIGQDEDRIGIFQILNRDEDSYSSNRFSTYIAEIPLQLRWRTSTAEKSSFYRIYGGFTLGYIYHFRTNFENGTTSIRNSNISELNRLRTGVHLSFGSNFVNFHVQYNFNSLFDANIQGTDEEFGIEIFKFGFIFYML